MISKKIKIGSILEVYIFKRKFQPDKAEIMKAWRYKRSSKFRDVNIMLGGGGKNIQKV